MHGAESDLREDRAREVARPEMLIVRVESWRFALPLGSVKWVHDSAMPVLRPGPGGARAYFVAPSRPPIPLVFAARLFGSTEVRLCATDKVLELESVALWITAVDDVCEGTPTARPHDLGALFVQTEDGAVAVLDIERLAAAVRAQFTERAINPDDEERPK